MHPDNVGTQFIERDMTMSPDKQWLDHAAFEDGRAVGFVHSARAIDRHYVPTAPWARDEMFDDDGQGRLFGSLPAEPWTVKELYVRPGHEHVVPTLLGLAALHSLRTSGAAPKPSNNLSVHSERMVRHLADRGLVQMPDRIARNRIDKPDADQQVDDNYFTTDDTTWPQRTIPQEEVDQASRAVRAALRPARRPAPRGKQKMWPI